MTPPAWLSRWFGKTEPQQHPHAIKPTRAGEIGRTLIVVVPLTLLIWVYAEQAQKGADRVSVLIAVAVSDPNLTAAVTESADTAIAVDLYGPRGQIEQLKNRIEAALSDRRLRIILPDADASVGPHNIDATRLLNNDPIFANSGVTATHTEPSQIRVTVDPLASAEATVILPPNLPVTLLSHSFEPNHVTLRGPAPAMKAAFPTFPTIPPTVMVDAGALSAVGAVGGTKTLELQLISPTDERLKLSTSRVKMTFEIGSTVKTDQIQNVFIDVVRPISDDGSSKVIISGGKPVLQNVKIRGPASLVSKYVGGQPERTLRAMLKVSQDDVGRGELERDVMWPSFEDGAVKVIEGPYRVSFEVRDLGSGK